MLEHGDATHGSPEVLDGTVANGVDDGTALRMAGQPRPNPVLAKRFDM